MFKSQDLLTGQPCKQNYTENLMKTFEKEPEEEINLTQSVVRKEKGANDHIFNLMPIIKK